MRNSERKKFSQDITLSLKELLKSSDLSQELIQKILFLSSIKRQAKQDAAALSIIGNHIKDVNIPASLDMFYKFFHQRNSELSSVKEYFDNSSYLSEIAEYKSSHFYTKNAHYQNISLLSSDEESVVIAVPLNKEDPKVKRVIRSLGCLASNKSILQLDEEGEIFQIALNEKTRNLIKDFNSVCPSSSELANKLKAMPGSGVSLVKLRAKNDLIESGEKVIYADREFIRFLFPYDERIVERIKKSFPGARFSKIPMPDGKPDKSFWQIPIQRVQKDLLKLFVDEFSFNVDSTLFEKFSGYFEELKDDFKELISNSINSGFDGKRLTITGLNNPVFTDRIDRMINIYSLSNAKYNKETQSWVVSIDDFDLSGFNTFGKLLSYYKGGRVDHALRDAFSYLVKIDQEQLAQKGISYAIDGVELKTDVVNTEKGELLPYQRVAVQYACDQKKIFLADDQGLGKTIEALASVEYADEYPLLICSPASVKYNWKKEYLGDEYSDGWLPHRRVQVIDSSNDEIDYDSDVVIINYDLVSGGEMPKKILSRGFNSVVVDESHYIKNPDALRTPVVVEACKKADMALLLSGTPAMNKPKELITQLDALDMLENFGGESRFKSRYCDAKLVSMPIPNSKKKRKVFQFEGSSNIDELGDKLRRFGMIRRLKRDVADEIPGKAREIYQIPIENRELYDAVEEDLNSTVKKILATDSVFQRKLDECSNNEERDALTLDYLAKYGKKQFGEYEVVVKMNRLRTLAVEGKMKGIIDFAERFYEKGKKLVIFASHIESQKIIYEGLKEYGAVHIFGSDKPKDRQKAINEFQHNEDVRFIVCSIKAAREGVTLTAASDIAFAELDWTYAAMAQAEDRVNRKGQTEAVKAYYLVDENTIDGRMLYLINSKKGLHSGIMNDAHEDSISLEEYDEVTSLKHA